MHRNRRWGVVPVTSAEELARKLTETTWTLCTGFYVVGHEDYLFVNDSTHEDGAQEFAVLKGKIGSEEFTQLESITFSWARLDQACEFVQAAISGRMDDSEFAHPLKLHLETLADHGRCHACA